MNDWQYFVHGRASGPVDERHLRALLTTGTLSVDTPVRRVGARRWLRAGMVRAFEGALYPFGAETLPAFDAASPLDHAPAPGKPVPRLLARGVDVWLFAVLCALVLMLTAGPPGETAQGVFGLAVLLGYTVVEAAALATLGTTPGRALLGIRLRTVEGGRPSFARALTRALAVWLKGLAAGVAPINLVTGWLAYRRLSRRGITSWDEDGRFVVEHDPIAPWRYAVAALVIVAPFIALASAH